MFKMFSYFPHGNEWLDAGTTFATAYKRFVNFIHESTLASAVTLFAHVGLA
jgi:hypothetical protein